jgi:hypothetical protein
MICVGTSQPKSTRTRTDIDQTKNNAIRVTRDSLVFGWILENPVEEGRDVKLP